MLALKASGGAGEGPYCLQWTFVCTAKNEIPNAALKWIEGHTRRAVRLGASLDEHWKVNFFLSGGNQPSARIQRYRSFLTEKRSQYQKPVHTPSISRDNSYHCHGAQSWEALSESHRCTFKGHTENIICVCLNKPIPYSYKRLVVWSRSTLIVWAH